LTNPTLIYFGRRKSRGGLKAGKQPDVLKGESQSGTRIRGDPGLTGDKESLGRRSQNVYSKNLPVLYHYRVF